MNLYKTALQDIEKRFKHLEWLDPSGKIIAIEELNHRKNVFNQMVQEVEEGNEAGYTLNDLIQAHQDFTKEYDLALANLK